MLDRLKEIYGKKIIENAKTFDDNNYYFYTPTTHQVFGISKTISTEEYELLKLQYVEKKVYSKNEKQEKIIPENTRLLGTKIDGECITIDFSTEFLNYDKTNENSKNNLINSIVNTLTELTEINKVKFLVDGTENTEFSETYTRKTM